MRRRVICTFHESLHYGRDAFQAGFEKLGYYWEHEDLLPRSTDILLIWNRGLNNYAIAERFESAGARVLVAENGYLGKKWRGEQWYALAWHHHNGAGRWPVLGPERLQGWALDPQPWRQGGNEIVLLPQRGIGEPGIAMPPGWLTKFNDHLLEMPVRIRNHPGKDEIVPLQEDLRNALAVCTWASGAAIKAVILGIPVIYDYPLWIGARAGTHLSQRAIKRDDGDRLAMLQLMSGAMWSRSEITDGSALERYLGL